MNKFRVVAFFLILGVSMSVTPVTSTYEVYQQPQYFRFPSVQQPYTPYAYYNFFSRINPGIKSFTYYPNSFPTYNTQPQVPTVYSYYGTPVYDFRYPSASVPFYIGGKPIYPPFPPQFSPEPEDPDDKEKKPKNKPKKGDKDKKDDKEEKEEKEEKKEKEEKDEKEDKEEKDKKDKEEKDKKDSDKDAESEVDKVEKLDEDQDKKKSNKDKKSKKPEEDKTTPEEETTES